MNFKLVFKQIKTSWPVIENIRHAYEVGICYIFIMHIFLLFLFSAFFCFAISFSFLVIPAIAYAVKDIDLH